ncbi:MAG: transposase, partial [Dehalococcoidia bacterium]|nr:transposase [Dehalococcoidia bacterium]
PLLPMFADGPMNKAIPGRYFERHSPFPYGSGQWKTVYNKRVSVERVFSRLKTYRKLDAIRTRRLPKVWLHTAMSLVVMNVAALVNLGSNSASLRKCVT